MGPLPLKDTTKLPLTALAYEKILARIINLHYPPGHSLEEKQVMADLALGRTPVREALLRLAGEGLLESRPNKGMRVPSITLQRVKSTFEAMRIFELGVVTLAIRQDVEPFMTKMETANEAVKNTLENEDILGMVEANHTFHIAFAECSRNEYLVRGVEEVRRAAKRLSYLSYAKDLGPENSLALHLDSVIVEHLEMMTLLKERREEALSETIVRHIRAFQERIALFLTS